MILSPYSLHMNLGSILAQYSKHLFKIQMGKHLKS